MMTKQDNKIAARFLKDVARLVVLYMKSHNIPMTAILSTNVIELCPRCSNVFGLIDWDSKIEEDNIIWYNSEKHFLTKNGNLKFNYDAIKYKIVWSYLTHKITWR